MPARLVALRGEPALELGDDAVHGGEVLQRAGRQRAVELVERARRRQLLRALDLRALELAPQRALEAADLVAGQRRRLALLAVCPRAPGSVRRPSARRMRCTSTPSTPEPWPRWPKAAIASRARSRMADSSPSRSACSTASRSASSVSSSASWSPCRPRRRPRLTPRRDRLRLGGAEEEALEDEVEDAPVLGGLGQRRGQRLAELGRLGPADLAQRGEPVQQLARPQRHALAPQVLPEREQLRVEAHVTRASRA